MLENSGCLTACLWFCSQKISSYCCHNFCKSLIKIKHQCLRNQQHIALQRVAVHLYSYGKFPFLYSVYKSYLYR